MYQIKSNPRETKKTITIPTPLPPPNDDLCGICNIVVNDIDKSLAFDTCNKWIHSSNKCNKLTRLGCIGLRFKISIAQHCTKNQNDTQIKQSPQELLFSKNSYG